MLSNSAFLLAMPGGSEWIFIILAVLILFGGRKIPEFMRGLGKGIREFNDAKSNVKKEIEDGMQEKDKPANKSLATKIVRSPFYIGTPKETVMRRTQLLRHHFILPCPNRKQASPKCLR